MKLRISQITHECTSNSVPSLQIGTVERDGAIEWTLWYIPGRCYGCEQPLPMTLAAALKIIRKTPKHTLAEFERDLDFQKAHFEDFWSRYPKVRRNGKQAGVHAWIKLWPDLTTFAAMLVALSNQKNSKQWTKDGGQFIPLPATWLNGRRWEDEGHEAQTKGRHRALGTEEQDLLRRSTTGAAALDDPTEDIPF